MDLLERIIEVTANSVTPEEFKETWGYSIDEHVADMMDRIRELEGKEAPVKEAKVVAEQELRPAALPAADAAQSETPKDERSERKGRKVATTKVGDVRVLVEDSTTLSEVAEAIRTLAKKLAKLTEVKVAETGKVKVRQTSVPKEEAWTLKLVAVNTGSGRKTWEAGEPLVIKRLDRPATEGRIVAKVCGPTKSGRKGLIEVKPGTAELKGVEEMVLADGVRGLMVDVGGLSLGHTLRPGMKGPKGIGPSGPKGGPK